MRRAVGIVLTILLLFSSVAVHIPNELSDEPNVERSGTATNLNIVASSTIVTADRVIQFTASLTDSNGQSVTGGVTWSASNGTIEETGLFFPWSSGPVTITAMHGSLTSSMNVTVTNGWASTLEIDTGANIRARNPHTFSATLFDSKGNSFTSSGILWEVNGVPLNVGNPLWIPPQPGDYSVTAYYQEIQVTEVIEVVADVPFEFVFTDNIVMRSGGALQIVPTLQDAYGYPMNLYASGTLNWEADNGVINGTGWFFPQEPGVWNVSVRSSGNITGNGSVRVLPADAALLSMTLGEGNISEVLSGEDYDLRAILTDSLGDSSEVIVPLSNWTIPSGEIAWSGEHPVWTPNDVGEFTITVQESGLEAEVTVNVTHGLAQDIVFISNERVMNAGDDVLLTLNAIDSAGNTWSVNGTISTNQNNVTTQDHFVMLRIEQLGQLSLSGTWLNPENNQTYSTSISYDIQPGDLALISLNGNGAIIPADEVLDLNPRFFDGYGNEISDVELNWTIDGVDSTLQLQVSNSTWYPESLGGHEIIANADGIFASIRLNVVAGSAYNLRLDFEEAVSLVAGSSEAFYFEAIDVYGNTAPARNLSTLHNESEITVNQSNLGPGWWDITGFVSGNYNLNLTQDSAELIIPVSIDSGNPVRILVELDGSNFSQGQKTLLTVNAVDSFGNVITLDSGDVEVDCTSGRSKFVTGNTWEVNLDTAGRDRKCTVTADGLVAQYYFEVDNVLFNGLLGSSNTAVSLISVLLGLVLAVLVVLIRKKPASPEEKWIDEEFENADLVDEESEATVEEESEKVPTLEDSVLEEKKQAASSTGVMQAINSDQQGKTGWYVDASGEIMKWEVTESGEWNRLV